MPLSALAGELTGANLAPAAIDNLVQLEMVLSEPTEQVVDVLARLEGDILVLGVGGKMGPTLARMARRASDIAGRTRRVIGVSRFTSPQSREQLDSHAIETVACDLLDPRCYDQLPEAENVIFMPGLKFGSAGRQSLTWAMNCYLPAMVSQKFRSSRLVAFSSGNVYGFSSVAAGGSREDDPPRPVGEYAMSCLGRERIFEHFSRVLNIPLALVRLNYACELRYGVLVDIAEKVWTGRPVDLTMGFVNVLWQADANAMALCAFDHVSSPPFVVNLAGPELVGVRLLSEQFGQLFGTPVEFCGQEAPDALISNGHLGHQLFGYPRKRLPDLVPLVADWMRRGGENWRKPTHFEVRDGRY